MDYSEHAISCTLVEHTVESTSITLMLSSSRAIIDLFVFSSCTLTRLADSCDNKRTGTTINGATEGESRISEGSGFGREGRVVGSPRGRRLVEPP